MKKLLLLILFMAWFSGMAFSQKKVTVKIKTSAECDMCKTRLESNLIYEKGVKFCKLDVPSKVLSITYNSEKTNLENLKKSISMLGYDADELAADTAAYNKLPECCKKNAMK
jgi:hypothetical protein